ncbi:DUF2993 domain-containing protein [Leptolyngbyaceae cyanobacterium CCMR0082]|uniref:DUF2993 domain-containing protein n=2 Tax=Adonisia turfae TaxID=2950184 RepID=A0A6M0S7W1_9CYAN|nr:DUF2993 domain-containing protein [Adonisia turfae]MDV3353638.1 DUF2993 domain-containing protein [Leptothoe sp. LEGE 181152]NEZ55965.1 DUF2993 domain-containing protein [Adonisia turfae CCMR0081]NEZ63902.1 DUF2993 domain-containing protein [Adonisia turfae CCMR0082]
MTQAPSAPKGSRLISRVLPVAVKFWLQTQLDEIGELAFEIQATDRQVLSGYIPGITLSAQQAIYQGVRITHVNVQASDIKINIGQVLRGKPLRLQQEFPIEGQVAFDMDALAASATESILADGLLDFWQTLVAKEDVATEIATHYGANIAALKDPQLSEYQSKLQTLDTDLMLHLVRNEQSEIGLRGSLDVDHGHILRLTTAQWRLPSGEHVRSDALTDFCWNLGEQTDLQSLQVQDDQLMCQCRIMVQP